MQEIIESEKEKLRKKWLCEREKVAMQVLEQAHKQAPQAADTNLQKQESKHDDTEVSDTMAPDSKASDDKISDNTTQQER